jgi:type IV secretory pathway VirB2 component (pilin)
MRYVSVEHQKAIAPRYRQASLLVAGFIASVLLYLFIARVVTPGEPQPGSEKWQQPIYSGVLVFGLVVIGLRRLLMAQRLMNRAAASGGADNVLRTLLAVTIFICAAAELIAILGLIFYLMTADYQYSWRLGVIALLLMGYAFPRRGEWERILTLSAEAGRSQQVERKV